jgi:hypothetical protein
MWIDWFWIFFFSFKSSRIFNRKVKTHSVSKVQKINIFFSIHVQCQKFASFLLDFWNFSKLWTLNVVENPTLFFIFLVKLSWLISPVIHPCPKSKKNCLYYTEIGQDQVENKSRENDRTWKKRKVSHKLILEHVLWTSAWI